MKTNKLILFLFRIFIGMTTGLIAFSITKMFAAIRMMTSSDIVTTTLIGFQALVVFTYLLGTVVEKLIDLLSGKKISKENKQRN